MDGSASGAGCGEGGSTAGRGDWRALDRRLRRLARRRAADDVEEAACLRRARAEGLHRRFGYASFYEYAERVLGYTPGVVRERMRVADALVGLPKLRAAMTAGEVPYSAARELTRVATTATENDWLAATARARVREVEDMVRGRRLGDLPDAPPDPAARLHERRFLLTGAALGAYVAARARLETACGHPLTDSEVMEALCAASLAGTAATDPATRPPPYQIAITRCADCARAWVDAAGRSIELSATELARASCDAELLGRVDDDAPPRATKTIPPRIRRAVLRRDRGRCRVPGCTNARFVDVHHVIPRGKGGDHTPSRLAAMCSAHHQAAHDGRLKVDLDKRGRLRVAHADGRPYGSPPPRGEKPSASKAGAAPGASKVGAAPGASKASAASGASKAGAAPRALKASAAPGASKAGAAPRALKASAAPGASKASAAPGASKAGQKGRAAPGASKASAAPGASKASAAPGASKAGAAPGASKAGAASGAAQRRVPPAHRGKRRAKALRPAASGGRRGKPAVLAKRRGGLRTASHVERRTVKSPPRARSKAQRRAASHVGRGRTRVSAPERTGRRRKVTAPTRAPTNARSSRARLGSAPPRARARRAGRRNTTGSARKALRTRHATAAEEASPRATVQTRAASSTVTAGKPITRTDAGQVSP